MIGERAIADLEFEKVLDLVRQGCLSEEGRRYISPGRFSTDEDVIASRAGRIATILSRLANGDVVPDSFVSLDPLFEAEAAHEVDYDGRLLYDVSRYISSLDTLARFEEDPALCDSRLKELGRRISDSLEGDGSVKETHPLLRPLYKALEGERSRRSLFTQEFMNTNADLFQSREAVYRNERVVLPVRRDRKSMVQGYVQGASATGSTLFVEPFELVDLNNRVSLAQDEIVRMKHRILHDLSSSLRDVIPMLREMVEYVALFDFHYAFALFVKRTRSQRTVFSDSVKVEKVIVTLYGEFADSSSEVVRIKQLSAEYLETEEDIALFMSEAFATGDYKHIAHCLGIVARAKGMTSIAKETGLAREQLYKSFSEDGNPT